MITTTFGKALGGATGGCVSGRREVVELLRQRSRPYLFSNTLAPSVAATTLAVLELLLPKMRRWIPSPIGIGLSLVKYGATGKPSGVGEITGEIKITDAMTGELLGAALDKRVGGKSPQGIWDTWYNADSALQYWAKRVSYVFCTQRGDKDCVKP